MLSAAKNLRAVSFRVRSADSSLRSAWQGQRGQENAV